jgi:hypothetical protein
LKITWTKVNGLLAGLLMLAEEVIENGAVLLVNSLHFVDVFGHLFHALERLHQMQVFVGIGVGQVAQLLQKQRVLEDSLDGLDQERLQGTAVLLLGIAGGQEFLQSLIAFILGEKKKEMKAKK